eukprot:1176230-Prorocentrum_minimum.AAC.2
MPLKHPQRPSDVRARERAKAATSRKVAHMANMLAMGNADTCAHNIFTSQHPPLSTSTSKPPPLNLHLSQPQALNLHLSSSSSISPSPSPPLSTSTSQHLHLRLKLRAPLIPPPRPSPRHACWVIWGGGVGVGGGCSVQRHALASGQVARWRPGGDGQVASCVEVSKRGGGLVRVPHVVEHDADEEVEGEAEEVHDGR